MTIYTDISISGTSFIDYKKLNLKSTQGESNSASDFIALYDSPYGRHKNDFQVGQPVTIYADNSPITQSSNQVLFNGVVEKVKFRGEGLTQEVELSGRDYTLRLQDLTVLPIVYTNTEVSAIVKDIITTNNIPDITTNNVQTTTTTLKRIAFNHTPVFDAFKQLADLASVEGYQFYVDHDKDLHFEPKTTTHSGYELNNTNTISCDFDESRQGMANIIYVYGDRYLSAAPPQVFSAGSLTNGSVATLLYKPHNTTVLRNGSTLKGSVFGMTVNAVSGTDYAVSFDDRQVILFSGTSVYPNFPTTGSVVINYDRDLPIIKQGQDDTSITLYGPKVLKIQDNSIKDPATAKSILKARLRDTSPLKRVDVKVKGWYNLTPGNLITLKQPELNINEDLNIVSVDYSLDKSTIQNEQAIRLNLGKKFIDVTDKLKEYKDRLDKLESQNLQDSDIVSRLLVSTENLQVAGSNWNIKVRYTGSDYLWGRSLASKPFVWGTTGSGLWSGSYAYPTQTVVFSGT